MKRFKLLNNVFGWVVFAIAAVTYLMTLEPTASFWDCPEFISSDYKLEVGHPPGSPFKILTSKVFTLFASDKSHIAVMDNALSAVCSAFTILFLFWTITYLAKKVIVKKEEDYTLWNTIAILGSGMVGALVYTFSDTFWFSAVEAEVYGYSSFFTALVFWLMLKWDEKADEPGSDRWLVLIGYMMGLSIGVHILNLLAIPAMVLIYYFRKYNTTVKGVIWALFAAVALLGSVLYGIIPGTLQMASWFELLFVNVFGMPYNSGTLVYVVVTLALLSWTIYESYVGKNYLRMVILFLLSITIVGVPFFGDNIIVAVILLAAGGYLLLRKKNVISARWVNTITLIITTMVIGYSSFSIVVIRSLAQPPMDQNSPDNVFTLKSYLNRDQYGDRPLFYGQVYSAPVKLKTEGNICKPVEDTGEAIYQKVVKKSSSDKDKYMITGYKKTYEMDDNFMMFFPRMYDDKPSSIDEYKKWADIQGDRVYFEYCGEQRSEIKPTFIENLRFFFDYQLNYMYWRYFMWNFSGRQNDMQGQGEIQHGNWITGIGFIDNMLVGDQSKLPTELRENKGHNVYYMLPLLLGIFGIMFQVFGKKEGKQTFWVTGLLFFLTGIAIVLYLNQTPLQPRERDYAYAGSFYAFSIWVGLGILGIITSLDDYVSRKISAVVVSVLGLGVPMLMAQQNWDDHDRSGRTVCRDFGQNYLVSTKKNAIIFSNGDNDTFPLWYNQEVEGVGTDKRVCNLSYVQTDWYIDQMKRQAYESEPLPISWAPEDYVTGKNEVVDVIDYLKDSIDVKTAFDFVRSKDPQTKVNGESVIPTNKLFIPVDAQKVIQNGTLPASRINDIIPQIRIDLKRRLTKSEMMVLELLRTNEWKRPIYFCLTVGDDYYLGLQDHFELTGLTYQVLPVGKKGAGEGVNVDELYDNVMNKFKFGGINNPKVYIDENVMRMCRTHRMVFSQLVTALVQKGDMVRAKKTLDYCDKMIPTSTVNPDYYTTILAEAYYKTGNIRKGDQYMEAVAKNNVEYIDWIFSLTTSQQKNLMRELGQNMAMLQQVLRVCDEYKQKTILNKYLPRFIEYSKRVQM